MYMDVYVYGCVSIWMCMCMDVYVHGCVCVWMCMYMDVYMKWQTEEPLMTVP